MKFTFKDLMQYIRMMNPGKGDRTPSFTKKGPGRKHQQGKR